jgi:ligand-binding sensor domain-containing protein
MWTHKRTWAIDAARQALLVMIFGLSVLPTDAAWSQARWASHLDPSWIREIVHSDGDLLMATGGGLLVYDVAAGSFAQYTNISGLPSNDLSCLFVDDNGLLYVGTNDVGVFKVRISGGGLDLLRSINQRIDGLADNEVTSVARWGDDVVYGTVGGAGTIVNDFPAALYRDIEGMPSNQVNDVLEVGDFVWIATDSGMAVVDRLGLLRLPTGGPSSANVVGSDGQLVFVGTPDGVWTLDPSDSTWTNVGPVDGEVYSLHYDGQTVRAGGTRYFWAYQGGGSWEVNALDGAYRKYKLDRSASEVRGLVALADGDVYLGTGQPSLRKGFNLVRWDGSELTDLAPSAPAGNSIIRLSVDVDGSVWSSFQDFWVGKLAPQGEWVNYNSTIPASDSLSNQFLNTTCLADADGYKWFSTLSSPGNPRPIDRLRDMRDDDYANDEWAHYVIGDGGGEGLGSLRPQNAVLDPAGNRWFLSDDTYAVDGWEGINILSRNQSEWLQIKRTKDDVGILEGNVVDVAFDNRRAYVALRNTGVQTWTHNGYGWANLSTLDAADWSSTALFLADTDEEVTAVEIDSDGTLWVGTNNGLYRITNAAGGGDSPPDHFGLFRGFGAGLLSVKIRDLALDHEENLWVATEAGLNRVSREDENVIDAWSTAAEYQRSLSQLQYPFDVISPLVHELCQALAVHPEDPVIYIATANGLSVFNYPEPPPPPVALAEAYVYPNPLYGRLAHNELFIENVSGEVIVEIYNVEGELVHETPAGESHSAGESIWDLTDQGGFLVSSGVYFVRIIDATGSGAVIKPISIIR